MPPYMLVCVLTTLFQYMLFWFGFIDSRVLVYTHHVASSYHSLGSFLTPLDQYVQILKLELK